MGLDKDEDRVFLSPHSPRAIASRLFVLVLLNGLAVAFLGFGLYRPLVVGPGGNIMASYVAVIAIFFGMSLLIWVDSNPGTWLIDREGIQHRPPFRRLRMVRWDDVERVGWHSSVAILRGVRGDLVLPWGRLPQGKAEREAARRCVVCHLSEAFDLSDDPPTWHPTPRRLISLVRDHPLLAVSVAFLLCCWIAVAIPIDAKVAAALPSRLRTPTRAVLVIFWGTLPLRLASDAWERRVVRDMRQIHPAYPWRLRRSAVAK